MTNPTQDEEKVVLTKMLAGSLGELIQSVTDLGTLIEHAVENRVAHIEHLYKTSEDMIEAKLILDTATAIAYRTGKIVGKNQAERDAVEAEIVIKEFSHYQRTSMKNRTARMNSDVSTTELDGLKFRAKIVLTLIETNKDLLNNPELADTLL